MGDVSLPNRKTSDDVRFKINRDRALKRKSDSGHNKAKSLPNIASSRVKASPNISSSNLSINNPPTLANVVSTPRLMDLSPTVAGEFCIHPDDQIVRISTMNLCEVGVREATKRLKAYVRTTLRELSLQSRYRNKSNVATTPTPTLYSSSSPSIPHSPAVKRQKQKEEQSSSSRGFFQPPPPVPPVASESSRLKALSVNELDAIRSLLAERDALAGETCKEQKERKSKRDDEDDDRRGNKLWRRNYFLNARNGGKKHASKNNHHH